MGTKGTPLALKDWDPIIKEINKIIPIVVGGSIRRKKEICNDLDALVVTADGTIPPSVFEKMEALGYTFLSKGTKSCLALSKDNYQVDLTGCSPENQGAAWLHITGSADFNVGMRGACKRKGLTFSQGGLLKVEDRSVVAAKSEIEIFAALGAYFIPPEERESWYTAYANHKIPVGTKEEKDIATTEKKRVTRASKVVVKTASKAVEEKKPC